ncbi:plasmid partitioning protein RepB C-terminal domain-containing protein [Samsonia erythrinae]|uniref:ParB family chromosome partitioning protein n=1 Tax=Samsonia erythrinae TaxID=160434 RepID=A0A4R3VNK2_9GAMM|nr:plasmid partitioning protein RepB C-terminal domain-containing protein [Samsonia erythrinae]TCV08585.1 ParB family chromosome partitioning protein [Samsonia erythrinae]
MKEINESEVVMLDISAIKIVNPRVRNKRIHDEITKNIDAVGLKKPITVRILKNDCDGYKYALICGQGRLESLKKLNQDTIPAIIKNVDEKIGHVMSLVENVARRRPRSTELFDRVKDLKNMGLSDHDIGKRIGYSTQWVNNVTMLLEKGEKKLLGAFESGHIPLSIAVTIARSSNEEIQQLLLDAYTQKLLNIKQITLLRNIVARRNQGNKGSSNTNYIQHKDQRRMTLEELMGVYQKNINEHKEMQRKAELAKESLLLARQMMSELLKNSQFVDLLKREGLNAVPKQILDNSLLHKG